MISEFKIQGAYSGDLLSIYSDDSTTYPNDWIKLQINDGKSIEVKTSEIVRALKAIGYDKK